MNLKNAVITPFRLQHAKGIAAWLTERGSLTKKLQRRCGAPVEVKVVFQGLSSISSYEAGLLGISAKRWTWVREVELKVNQKTMVFARTVVCPKHTKVPFLFKALGNKPLGQLIYADPGLIEQKPVIKVYTRKSKIWPRISHYYQSREEAIGRHRTFQTRDSKVLVHEVILPQEELL